MASAADYERLLPDSPSLRQEVHLPEISYRTAKIDLVPILLPACRMVVLEQETGYNVLQNMTRWQWFPWAQSSQANDRELTATHAIIEFWLSGSDWSKDEAGQLVGTRIPKIALKTWWSWTSCATIWTVVWSGSSMWAFVSRVGSIRCLAGDFDYQESVEKRMLRPYLRIFRSLFPLQFLTGHQYDYRDYQDLEPQPWSLLRNHHGFLLPMEEMLLGPFNSTRTESYLWSWRRRTWDSAGYREVHQKAAVLYRKQASSVQLEKSARRTCCLNQHWRLRIVIFIFLWQKFWDKDWSRVSGLWCNPLPLANFSTGWDGIASINTWVQACQAQLCLPGVICNSFYLLQRLADHIWT